MAEGTNFSGNSSQILDKEPTYSAVQETITQLLVKVRLETETDREELIEELEHLDEQYNTECAERASFEKEVEIALLHLKGLDDTTETYKNYVKIDAEYMKELAARCTAVIEACAQQSVELESLTENVRNNTLEYRTLNEEIGSLKDMLIEKEEQLAASEKRYQQLSGNMDLEIEGQLASSRSQLNTAGEHK